MVSPARTRPTKRTLLPAPLQSTVKAFCTPGGTVESWACAGHRCGVHDEVGLDRDGTTVASGACDGGGGLVEDG